jgi:hypothetical protein
LESLWGSTVINSPETLPNDFGVARMLLYEMPPLEGAFSSQCNYASHRAMSSLEACVDCYEQLNKFMDQKMHFQCWRI